MAQRMAVGEDGWIEMSREVKNAVEDRIYNKGENPREAIVNHLSEAYDIDGEDTDDE